MTSSGTTSFFTLVGCGSNDAEEATEATEAVQMQLNLQSRVLILMTASTSMKSNSSTEKSSMSTTLTQRPAAYAIKTPTACMTTDQYAMSTTKKGS